MTAEVAVSIAVIVGFFILAVITYKKGSPPDEIPHKEFQSLPGDEYLDREIEDWEEHYG